MNYKKENTLLNKNLGLARMAVGMTGLCAFILPLQVIAEVTHDFGGEVYIINNDNVYKMPGKSLTGISVESGTGSLAGFEYEFLNKFSSVNQFFTNLGFQTESYGSKAGDADTTVFSLDTGFEQTFDVGRSNQIKSSYGVFYDRKDKTYVSRFTGLIPTSGGQELADRFSFTETGLFAELDYFMGSSVKLSLDIEYKNKDYTDDYTDLGLTNYDYRQWKIKGAMRYKPNEQLTFRLELPLAFREYDDRRAQDLGGADIIPSDLEYDYTGIEGDVAFEVSDNLQIQVGIALQNREDNYEGALDYDRTTTYVKVGYDADKDRHFNLSYKNRERDYDNATTGGVKRTVSKDSLEVEYEQTIFKSRIKGLTLRFAYEDTSLDHESPFLSYDQNIFSVGVIWKP